MKKEKIIVLLAFALLIQSSVFGQIDPCISITRETIEPSPQSGAHNYFGVKLILSQTYDQNITVSGYIYDQGEYNTNHPYELTIEAGNLTAETALNFYQTTPTSTADVSINGLYPLYVSKDGIVFRTHGDCTQLNAEVKDLSTEYSNSVRLAVAAGDSLLGAIDQSAFFPYLLANGINSTASYYSMSIGDVTFISNKYEAAWSSFWEIVENKYGPVDSITSEQLNVILEIETEGDRAAKMAPPDLGTIIGCGYSFHVCTSNAKNARRSRDAGCEYQGGQNGGVSALSYSWCLIQSKNRHFDDFLDCAEDYGDCVN